MTDFASAPAPIAIDRVESSRGEGEDTRLRLSGRWLIEDPRSQPEALLVVQLKGRRHRFAADRSPAGPGPPPGRWHAQFTVPPWAVPSRPGQAAVWVGTSVIPVGPPGTPSAPVPEATSPAPEAAAPEAAAPEVESSAPEAAPPAGGVPKSAAVSPQRGEATDPAPDTGRGGPLANLLLKETVAALHSELERRGVEAAQLRGALADAQSELQSRAARQASLEKAHGELRRELEQLMAAVVRQRQEFDERLAAARDEAEAELARAREHATTLELRLRAHSDAEQRQAHEAAALREQLATAHISRDGAISEAGGLRTEVERLAAELTVMREQVDAHGGDLGEAQRLLADARALTAQLRGGGGLG